jgi:HAD superfamily hydrolase (TIGR01509 family)
MNNSAFDVVIFDCDGVLVESEELACRIYVDMFREYGHSLDYEETLHKFYGMTLETRLKISEQELGWAPPADFIPRFHQTELRLSEHELKTVPHVHELIESITAPICVASNGSRKELNFRLEIAGLLPYFEGAIFSGTEVAHPKPAPDVYLAAAKYFNIDPSRCVVVEDSVLGVTAAIRAGMTVYGHTTFNSAETLQAAGAIPFYSMLELKDIFARKLSVAS